MAFHSRLFRSEEVALYQIFIQYDSAYETTVNLGEAGIVEFLDLHLMGSFHQRQFSREVELCDEIERKMDLMRKELQKEKLSEERPEDEPPAPYSTEIFDIDSTRKTNDKRSLALFWKLKKELKGMGRNVFNIKRDYLKYTEYKHVMVITEPLFKEGLTRTSNDSLTRLLLEDASSGMKTVGFVAGVVLREKVHILQRVIWRVCQGNVFFSYGAIPEKIEDPDTGLEVFKSVFYAIYQGENLEQKVMKVCDGFRANVYLCPLDKAHRKAVMDEITTALDDLDEILVEADVQRRYILEIASRNILKWNIMIWKAKAAFTTMNKFQPDKMRKVFIAECWVPTCKLEQLNSVLLLNQNDMIMKPILVKIETSDVPPTFHDLNKFTRVFQDLIDAYGANTYQEHNPAPYYIITFPFLFSIMFGDAGHGLIMTLAALYMLWNEKEFTKKKPGGEIGRIFFAGRYIVLLMGLFSIQSGLLYNDIFSRCTHFFTSSWHYSVKIHQLTMLMNGTVFIFDPETDWDGTPYPFGLDPLWHISKNAIVFRNSLKMKMSIIFGVVQMLFGLILGINNIMFFKHYSDIFTVFIPQIIFLTFLFMYLSILIIMKWLMYGPGGPEYRSPSCAPSILNIFIGMILFTDPPVPSGCRKDMYSHQGTVQLVLLACAVVCIPWLFIVKPVLEIRQKKNEREVAKARGITRTSACADKLHITHKLHRLSETVDSRVSRSSAHGEPVEPYYDFCQKFGHLTERVTEAERKKKENLAQFTFTDKKSKVLDEIRASQGRTTNRGSVIWPPTDDIVWEPRASVTTSDHDESNFDIFIHQAIHSIEFLLGTVSNTASYLRLWALSLAHEQLSDVVWSQLFGIALTCSSTAIQPIAIVIIFLFWAVLSVAILVLMEGLSAFLHTLRLHWIEFQSKFYDGNGRSFQPFNFADIVQHHLM